MDFDTNVGSCAHYRLPPPSVLFNFLLWFKPHLKEHPPIVQALQIGIFPLFSKPEDVVYTLDGAKCKATQWFTLVYGT